MLIATTKFYGADGSVLREVRQEIPTGRHKSRRDYQQSWTDHPYFQKTATGGVFTRRLRDGYLSVETVEIDVSE